MTAYYNEHDPFAAAWLRELIAANMIAKGDVDERSIEDVRPSDLVGYNQCHFFAGIGVWSYALRRAGWSDDRPVWTGSCPCQPFSAAGKGSGFADERHLWPAFHHLIRVCQPVVVFGEQVASKDGLAWLDLVQTDMEATGYALGAVDLCAAGVGAPHIRQRLWWVAEGMGQSDGTGRQSGRERSATVGFGASSVTRGGIGRLADAEDGECQFVKSGREESNGQEGPVGESGPLGGLADTTSTGSQRTAHGGLHSPEESPGPWDAELERSLSTGGMADAGREGLEGCDSRSVGVECAPAERDRGCELEGEPTAGPTNGFWRDADWLFCRDGKWRPVMPGTFPLAHGAPARVGRLRGYGNAINAEAATEVIEAYLYDRDVILDVLN